ncbi:Sir2 family histone deacetylase Hst4 [Metarhizium album ARSEF 1941]|uniref:Sir2 family histone deacetylase Hst4 n=1 Tax=Metarhizium album (strain ARSEF 1941) TaxID=1081103 RepID=A0A0B2WVD5_METAS|nr:Sir2 family histone deacetylase Hst4 [Metarhizium album ARSEF 1941]KHO00077.1 Sir2 family histone deacetylase Hst4 [Metarhizium album ARSEF 1941]
MEPDAGTRYPSPSPTSTSGTQSPIKLGDAVDDSPRPAKKRRITPPRERITTYLNLMKSHDEFSHEDNFHMERLLNALRRKKKIVVVAGAGISVSAGIPDFRSSTGLFATQRNQHKLKASGKHLFDASVYKHESSTSSFHTMVREMSDMTKNAQPTPFHHLLASLAQEGRLLRLYSQNIDCIDTSMKPLHTQIPLEPKAPWPTTIQLHGSLDKMVCTKCGDIQPFKGDIFDGPEAPLCESCRNLDEVRTAHAGKRSHGIGRLRPRFVLYNEFNPDEDAIGNVMRADLRARPDAVLVVGTTLKVPGTRRLVKQLCQVARGRKDGLTAWLNIDSEPKIPDFKDCWDLVVKSTCDNIARLVSLPPWDCEIGNDYLVSKEQERERLSSPPAKLEVRLDGTRTPSAEDIQAMPTPRASPPPPPPPPSSGRKPLPEAKQSKLPFGAPKPPALTKAGKIAKPRGRKPKQLTKAPQPAPINGLLQTFKASKVVSDAVSGKKPGTRSPLPDRKPFKEEPNLVVSLPSPSHDAKDPGEHQPAR